MSNPEGDALLRPFRFEGLEVGSATTPATPACVDGERCDVLLALDFDGASTVALGDRLSGAVRRLGSDGVLLLGLSNRFGLRFWSGCPEPECGTLFTTLAGPEASPGPVPTSGSKAPSAGRAASGGRFASRRELSEALASAGFVALEWFFAVPDPTSNGSSGSLISEHLVTAAPGLAAELATGRPSADRQFPRLDLIPEALVARELARAGLFPEFADHFLVAAAPRAAGSATWSRVRPPAQEVGWHQAAGRLEPIVTLFELSDSGIMVSKRRLELGTARELGEFFWVPQARTPLAPGEPFRLRLEEHLVAGRSEEFLCEFSRFCAFVRAQFGREGDLAGEAIDALATNATLDESGSFHLFDLEWYARSGVPISWWILRNVLACLGMRGSPIADLPHGGALYEALCARAGVEPRLVADLEREAALGAAVRSSPPEQATREIAAALERPWPVPVVLGLDAGAASSGAELATAHRNLVTAYRRLESWALGLEARLLRDDAGSNP